MNLNDIKTISKILIENNKYLLGHLGITQAFKILIP